MGSSYDNFGLPQSRRVPVRGTPKGEGGFVRGESPGMVSLARGIADVAQNDVPALIVGESGTGKRAVAMEIHRLSGRQEHGFFTVECPAFESHLETWQANDPGVAAGTVYLRQIDALAAPQQRTVFQTFFGKNCGKDGWCGSRLIASTERSLDEKVRSGGFREDLFYRISNICLWIPPLRQRKEDIPALARYFAAKYSTLLDCTIELSPQVLDLLSKHSWPGNVRELEHAVRSIVAFGDETIALDVMQSRELYGGPSDNQHTLSLKETARAASRQAERELILNALSRTRWNRKRAARELQISYKALLYKLKQIGLQNA